MQLYPGWSARDNYGYGTKKKKRKKERTPEITSLGGRDTHDGVVREEVDSRSGEAFFGAPRKAPKTGPPACCRSLTHPPSFKKIPLTVCFCFFVSFYTRSASNTAGKISVVPLPPSKKCAFFRLCDIFLLLSLTFPGFLIFIFRGSSLPEFFPF